MKYFAPESYHDYLYNKIHPKLSYSPQLDYSSWREEVRKKLLQLLGEESERIDPEMEIEFEHRHDSFKEIRFVFSSEPCVDVPCHLLIPNLKRNSFPVVICLQGHTSGMHISLGRPKYEHDEESISGDRDFALQAIRQGYAALVLEQRCFGERKDCRPDDINFMQRGCHTAGLSALLLGRTMAGERVWDVSRVMDVLDNFSEIDTKRIACMGNSGGGRITYFAACVDRRIGAVMPSCSVCTFRDSIAKIDHCEDKCIPGIMRYFEMPDLSCLIAPRPLIVVAGRENPLFPYKGVVEAFEVIQRIYDGSGAGQNCRLVTGEGGHRFYASKAWPVFNELSGWDNSE